jgi:hypothetical protein
MRTSRFLAACALFISLFGSLSVLSFAAPAQAAESGLVVTARTVDPLAPVMVLTNRAAAACQAVGGSSLGTVAYTRVEQGGTAVEPIPVQVTFPDQVDYAMARRLVTLQPGQSVEVPLAVVPIGPTGHALEMVTWSEAAGPFAALYPLRREGALAIQLTYQIPIAGDRSTPLCAVVAQSPLSGAAGGPAAGWRWVFWVAIAVAVLLLALVVFLLRRRRRATAAAVLLPLVVLVGFAAWERPAHADITVTDPSLQQAFDDCMGVFGQPGHDPAGILPVLNKDGVNVQVQRPTTSGDDHAAALNANNIWIFWDPERPHRYFGSGGAADPCSTLYHEAHHAYQHATGSYNHDPCRTSDSEGRTLPRTEVLATHAQNALREKLGLPKRDHYGDVPLPATCEPPEPPRRCQSGNCGTSNGDPHVRTFDGALYQFQAVGEFVLARQTTGGYEVQVRQVPAGVERLVSVNAAVAMAVGADKVEVRAGGVGLVLLVGGAKQELNDTTLPDGGKLQASRHEVIVSWKDGSSIFIRPITSNSLRVVLEPATSQAGRLEGLLGDFDGDDTNDIRHRGGAVIKEPTFEALYPSYADSWRIDARSSLFTYEPGTGPKTYVDRTFPDREVKVDELPNRALAEEICRRLGVTDPGVLVGCILDVALTGQAEFAAAAASGQVIVGQDFGGARHLVRIEKAGDKGEITFSGAANQRIFVDVPVTTLPNSCGALRLSGPGGQLASGCLIGGRGYIDATTLPSAGTYTITFSPDAVGMARLHIITITDQVGTLTPDGPTVQVAIDKPGVVGRFTFAGKAGQKVFVDVPRSTLPHECGLLELRGPSGRLENGCLIYGSGEIEATVLPADGTYTVLLDPDANTVGTAVLALNAATDQKGAIAVNGPAVTAEIRQKGAAASLTFTASAGQRVLVEVTNSTLPHECGVLTLRGPGGFRRTGCIVNGDGGVGEREGVVLPASGTYTITVDPSSRAIGVAVVRVRR